MSTKAILAAYAAATEHRMMDEASYQCYKVAILTRWLDSLPMFQRRTTELLTKAPLDPEAEKYLRLPNWSPLLTDTAFTPVYTCIECYPNVGVDEIDSDAPLFSIDEAVAHVKVHFPEEFAK